MKTAVTPMEFDLPGTKRWAALARNWDLSTELDVCAQTRDSCLRQIGLEKIGDDQTNYDRLVSRADLTQQRIDVINLEIIKRKGRL
jgi:hypothetical protein